jgi:type II restriction enzyme
MFLKTVDEESYEQLVDDILAFRNISPYEKLKLFKQNERVVGLACHEWRYATGMLASAGIVDVMNDHDGRVIGELTYGNISKITGKPNAVRHYTEDYIVLKQGLVNYVDLLLAQYPYYQKPYPEDELSKKFNSSIVVDMYSFYPPELLREIGEDTEEDEAISIMLSVARDVYYYSHEETDTGEHFERALTTAFNLFEDVEAERIGGAGNADVECIFYPKELPPKKFDIEAKSTSRKLLQINSRRLKTHRLRIGSKYTMIVTPNFSIGVLKDIAGEDSVIIKAATLANYLYQYIVKNGREISYEMLDRIIEANIGLDITDSVNDYVYSNFGHAAADLSIR